MGAWHERNNCFIYHLGKFSKKIRNGSYVILRDPCETDSCKHLKAKISFQTSFKEISKIAQHVGYSQKINYNWYLVDQDYISKVFSK
jgi:hypothetical protein